MNLKTNNYVEIFNSISDGVVCHKALLNKKGYPSDYVSVGFNDAFAEMFTLNNKDLTGKKISALVKEFKKTNFDLQEQYNNLFSGKKKGKLYSNHQINDRWYTITAYKDSDDLFWAIFRDITSLRESKEQLSNILESMDEVIWSATFPKYEIIYVSPSVEKIFGLRPTDFIDSIGLWRKIVFSGDSELISQKIIELEQTGKVEFECRALNAQKEIIWLNVRATIIYDFQKKPLRLDGVLSDITDRKKAEEIIHESETRYRTLVKNVPGVIFRCVNDSQFTMIFISEAIKNITGYGPDVFINNKKKSFNEIIHHDDLDLLKKAVNEGIVAKEPYNIRYRIIDSAGNEKWVAERGQGVFDEEGHLLYIDGIIIDVTERIKIEADLLEAEQKYRLTLDKMMEGAQIIGLDWRYKYINDTAAAHGRRKKEELLGKTMMECFPGIENSDIFRVLKRCMEDRLHFHMENEFVMDNGEVRFYELSIQAVPEGVFILSLDITERKQVENELLRTSEELENFFNLTLDLLCIADTKGNFIKVNRSWEEILGYSTWELEKKNLVDFVHPEDVASTLESLEKLSNQEKILNLINRFLSKSGYYHYIEWRIYPRGDTIYAAARDITDRVLYEEQLKHQSFHDPLTGIYNRAYFEEEIRRLEGGREYPITVFSVDVDGLKLVNDSLGHTSGDEILKINTRMIKESLRDSDIFARVGGDEFAIILPGTDFNSGEAVMKRIFKKIEDYNGNNPEIPLSVSIGLSTTDNPGNTIEEVFKKADNKMYRDKLQKRSSARKQIIESLQRSLDEKDFNADGHSERIADLSKKIGKEKGLPAKQLKALNLLSHVHDIGKVAISKYLLMKKDVLTNEEIIQMRQHSEIGYRIASSTSDLAKISDLILKHHERWDGKGYPQKLQGEQVPLECRIFAIAESYDVMTNYRPYKATKSHEEAIEEIKRCSGSQFDPELVKIFIKIFG